MEIDHDGCVGCKYEDTSMYVSPCSACKHNYIDRYERKNETDINKYKLSIIDRDEIKRQTESLSIKAMVQVIDQLAANINKIITYINEEK